MLANRKRTTRTLDDGKRLLFYGLVLGLTKSKKKIVAQHQVYESEADSGGRLGGSHITIFPATK